VLTRAKISKKYKTSEKTVARPLDIDPIPPTCGVIDGDGCVDKHGTIRVRSSDEWILDLTKLSLDTTQPRIDRILPSGKPYYSVNIHRSKFIEHNPFVVSEQKMYRMYNARRIRQLKRIPCPTCNLSMAHTSKQCRSCYFKSRKNPISL